MSNDKKKVFLYFSILFILVCLIYQETLRNFFLADDALWIQQAKMAGKDFTYVFKPVGRIFRPGITFVYLMIYTFFKLDPKPYYAVSMLIHFLNSLLVYCLCFTFLKEAGKEIRSEISFFSALFFSALYLHHEAVIWIGAVGDLFLCFFCLLSFLCLLRVLDGGAGKMWYFSSLLFYALSLFFKETAFIFPLVFLGYALLFRREKTIFVFPFFVAALAALLFYRVFNPGQHFSMENALAVVTETLKMFFIFFLSFFGFFKNRLWIVNEMNAQILVAQILFQIMTMSIFGAMFLFYLKKRSSAPNFASTKKKGVLFLVLFMAAAYIPAALFIPGAGLPAVRSHASLRYLYLPSAGFCILMGIMVSELFKHEKRLTVKGAFIFCVLMVNVIPIYQSQWASNAFGNVRLQILKNVMSLNDKYRDKPFIFLIGYPEKTLTHFQPYALTPLFRLYGKNVFFLSREKALSESVEKGAGKICFFEWEGITFMDRTNEYRRLIKQRSQMLGKVKAHSKASNHKNKRL